MKGLSLNPDKDMEWIYDYTHQDYNSARARYLRAARAAAIAYAPEWMKREAELNDAYRDKKATG